MKTVLVFFAYCVIGIVSQRWYYTGNFNNEKATAQNYSGGLLDYERIFFPDSNDTILYSGGMVLRLIERDAVHKTIDDEFLNALCKLKTIGELVALEYEHTSIFNIFISENYPPVHNSTTNQSSSPVLEAEIGRFDQFKGIYLDKKWIEISNGNLTSTVVLATYRHDGSTEDYRIRHRIVFTSDYFGRRALVLHTWDDLEELDNMHTYPSTDVDQGINLRIMTYNLWHNNPLSWVYHDKR